MSVRTLWITCCLLLVWPTIQGKTDAFLASEPWTRREYVDFRFRHYSGTRPLPHLRHADERVTFERLVDPANIRHIVASDLPLEEKRLQIAIILAVMGETRAAYNYAVLIGEPLQEELVRVQSFTLDLLTAAIRLTPTAPSDRRDAWSTTYLGVVQSLGERNIYSTTQLASLAVALARHYPVASRILSTADRYDVENRIARMLAAETDPALRTAYAQLLQTIGAN